MFFLAISAYPQARTAERIVDVTFDKLNNGNPPNGSIRNLINGLPGSTPCQIGPGNVLAYKIDGVWQCPKFTPGVGSGDVLGASVSSVGELVLFADTSGKTLGRSNTLNGIPFLTSGVVSTLSSSGTGNVVRATEATLTNPVLLTPTIASFNAAQHTHQAASGGGQLDASAVFSTGTVPPARIIVGSITNSKCLRVNNVGQIAVAADDCGSGGGGAPGGVSGNITFNESGAFGGIANSSYDPITGRLTFNQKADTNDTIYSQRFTDTSPTGSFLKFRNAAGSTDLFLVSVSGAVTFANTLTIKNSAAPSTPSAGNTVLWTDSTDKNLKAQDDGGNVSITLRPISCTGTDKISSISSAGVVTCTADQGGTGTGVITLNGLNTSDQSFAVVDDTNIDLNVSSVTSTHTFTMAWVGTLAKARQHAATAYTDAGNTWSTGAQSFAAATSLTVPTGAGASPTTNAQIAYDSTSNTLEAGINSTNRIFAFTTGSQTFTDKTLDNSTTANLRDTLLTLQDNTDSTKTANFELSGITTGTNRVVSIANAASTTVQPSTLTPSQWVTHIDSAGVQQKAQPTLSDFSGTVPATRGGTDQTTVSQGDLLFGSATNLWSRLAKSTSATRYLSNTGASNNPAWAQVDLTNGVTGVLPSANWTLLTTKGDLLTFTTTTARLGVGTDGFALIADSTQAAGIKWAAVTASAAGSTTQLQRNNAGALGGISGAVSDGTSVIFTDGALILNGGDYGASDESLPGSPVEKSFYLNTNTSSRRLYLYNNGSFRALFQAGIDQVNLASANVTGITPLANGGTNQTSWTAARCVRVNAGGTALEAAAADCGTGGTITGTDTHVMFFDGANSPAGDAGFTYNKTTDTATLAGALVLSSSGAGFIELAEGSPPSAVANRLTITAPADAPAGGLVYVLPSDTPTNGEQLTANISGTVITLSWDAAGSGGSGDAVSVNGSAATDANFINTAASATVPSITWSLNTGATPDEVSISAVGAASATEAGVVTANAQTFGGQKTLTTPIFVTYWQSAEVTAPANPAADNLRIYVKDVGGASKLCSIDSSGTESCGLGGGGSGTINSGATNVLPKYVGSTTLDDSLLSDDATTLTYSGTGGLSLTATGGGYIQFTEGTPPSIVANTVQHAVAADAPAGGVQYLWGSVAAASGVLRVANSSGVMTVTQDAGISHLASSTSADLAGVLTNETGSAGGGVAVFSVKPTITFANTGLTIRDTDDTHDLTIAPGSNLTAARTLTLTTGDAARTLDISGGNLTLAGAFTTSGANALTLTTTGSTNVTLPTSGTLAVTGSSLAQFASTTSAELRTLLSNESGTGNAVFGGGDIGAGTATTASANDNSTLIATTAYVQTELTGYASDTATFTNKTYDTAGTGNVFTSSHKVWLPAAGCQNTVAGSFWDLPTSTPAVAACVTGTNTQKGYLDFADTSGGFSAQTTLQLPDDFTGTVDADIFWLTTATSGNAKWSLSVSCTNTDATQTDDQAFETASTVTTAAPGVASRVQTSSITSLTITNCGANDIMHVKVFRDGNDASDTIAATARFYGLRLTFKRQQ